MPRVQAQCGHQAANAAPITTGKFMRRLIRYETLKKRNATHSGSRARSRKTARLGSRGARPALKVARRVSMRGSTRSPAWSRRSRAASRTPRLVNSIKVPSSASIGCCAERTRPSGAPVPVGARQNASAQAGLDRPPLGTMPHLGAPEIGGAVARLHGEHVLSGERISSSMVVARSSAFWGLGRAPILGQLSS